MTRRTRVLFVAWDGPSQNYLEGLFLPIFAATQERGFEFHVLQLRWGSPEAIGSARDAAERRGIPYTHHPIFRRPVLPATGATLLLGARRLARYVSEHDIDVVMPRSTPPAAMTLMARRWLRSRVLFDADGFAPDERVDFAGWRPTGLSYRLYRDIEAQMVRVADAVMTRTDDAKQILLARAGAGTEPDKIHVIPNGKDDALFSPGSTAEREETRAELGVPTHAPLVVYAGSLGPHYYPAEMFRFFGALRARCPGARMLVITVEHDAARTARAEAGVGTEGVAIRRLAAEQVARYVAAADLGLALRAPSFSQRGVSPIKVAEYLLCGVPVVATSGVGDLDAQLGGAEVGRLLATLGPESLEAAADWVQHDVLPNRGAFRERCRDRGVEMFGLQPCADRLAGALRAAVA